MKTFILALSTVALVATSTVKAEYFSPNVVSGVVVGGIAGAVIGNNSGRHRGGESAAIGAVAGGLIGARADQSRAPVSLYARPPAPVYVETACAPTVVYPRPCSRAEYRAPVRVYVEPSYRGHRHDRDRDHDHDHDYDSRHDHGDHRW